MDWKTKIEKAERIVPLVSHFAQIGLFMLTAWGLFYTVIPLYQKAAVDEQVAKQQAELAGLSARLRASYVKIRGQSVLQFVTFAGPACTGLLTPVSDEPPPEGQDFESQALKTDVRSCLLEQMKHSPPIGELNQSDLAAFIAEVDKIGMRANAARLAASMEVSELRPADPTKGPVAIGRFSERALVEMKQMGASDQQLADAKRKMSLNYQKDKIVSRYTDEARKEILRLRAMTWPDSPNPN